jgi:DNA-directed RNA polymerase subunit RPC12/RpoP
VATYEFPCKCMACGLHYTIWSWEDSRSNGSVFCPECGSENRSLMFPVKQHADEIFHHVPGFLPTSVGDMSIQYSPTDIEDA